MRVNPQKSVTIVMFDAAYQHGPFVLNGEYGRSNIVVREFFGKARRRRS